MQLVSIACNGTITVFTVVAWLQIAIGAGDPEHLAARGLASLKYFTVLSNFFSAIVSGLYCCTMLLGNGEPAAWLVVLKLQATTAVMLTFVTVVVLLGPTFGWRSMYQGGNLWLHLVLPLAAALDWCVFVPCGALPWWTSSLGMVPTLLYGTWYTARVLRYGPKQDGTTYDFYGFARWGMDKIPVVACFMLAVSWLIAALLQAVGGMVGFV